MRSETLKSVSLLKICGCICVCECFNKVCHQNAFISVDGGWRNFFLLLFCSFSLWLAFVSPISFLGSLCNNWWISFRVFQHTCMYDSCFFLLLPGLYMSMFVSFSPFSFRFCKWTNCNVFSFIHSCSHLLIHWLILQYLLSTFSVSFSLNMANVSSEV